MNYTEVTTNSYGSRVGNSFKSALFGILLIIGSVVLLWWNEGRTIDITKGLNEAEEITVQGNTEEINSELDGKVVYNTGYASTDEILEDKEFLISENAIKLIRTVEMYQWDETVTEKRKDNIGGSETVEKTYSYKEKWSSNKINSNSFKEKGHENPSEWKFSSKNLTASDVFIEKLRLSLSFTSKMSNSEILQVSTESFENFKNTNNLSNVNLENNYIYYGSTNSSMPDIGDLRISFKVVKPADITVIGVQNGDILDNYKTSRDTNISLLEYGTKSKDEMYQIAQDENKMMAWIFRAIGIVLMYIGFNMIFGIITTIAKILPILSTIIGFGTGLISGVLTLILGGGTIIVAWLFVRPILSISLFCIIIAAIYGAIKYKKEKDFKKIEE